jgi:ribonuclease E
MGAATYHPSVPGPPLHATHATPTSAGCQREFEIMTRKMIINAIDAEEVRIAILSDRLLQDFDIETRGVEKNKGNIYKGVVMAVEPALNAAFVNYGADKQGFLTANDVHPKYAKNGQGTGNDHDRNDRNDRNAKITDLLRPKQTVLVQVSKDEVSSKGAVLTTYLSLAGRYLVLMPDSETQGVSRKIDDEETRKRVREAAAKLQVPDNMGVIIRTAGKDRTRLELNRDLRVLLRLWDNIQAEAGRVRGPALIFKEQDVIIRALRDYFSADVDEIVLDADDAYDRAAEYMHMVMPNHRSALTRYVERRPIFNHYRIEDQLDVIYQPKVTLPSGGSIVIEPTEALVAIDVNSGKQKSGNQEETATETNVEAANEVARQLRLRDLGGIIVIDFIDMNLRKNQQRVEKAIKEALTQDKARIKVARISRNGTLEITRQRIRSALGTSVFDRCNGCHGTGHVLNPSSHAIAILRKVRDRASRGDLIVAKVRAQPEVANRLRTEMWSAVQDIERRFKVRVDVLAEHSFGAGQDDFTFETDPKAHVAPLTEPNFGPAPRPEDFGEPSPDGDMWADTDLDNEELRALEQLDKEDEARQLAEDAAIEAELAAEAESEESLTRRKRRVPRGREPKVKLAPVSAGPRATGKRVPARSLSHEASDETFDMPTFEMLDPRAVARPAKPKPRLAALEDDVASSSERPARRRRRRGRPDSLPQSPSQRTEGRRTTGQAAPESPKPVKSFWRRLLGL